MSEHSRYSNRENDDKPKVAQPKAPAEKCDKKEWPKAPELKKPDECKKPNCECPPGVGSESVCVEIENMIASQAEEIARAEKAKTFKTELEGLLTKAKAASQEYTQTKYDNLVKRWVDQDEKIAGLIYRLVCSLDCWRCVIECTICSRLNELITAEKWLYAEAETASAVVYNLYEEQCWRMRDKEKKERVFNRIKSVLAAWEKPAQTIDKILTENAKLIEDSSKVVGTEPGSAIYDVFFKLVPQHLAIAPPKDKAPTLILAEYTNFCECDTGKADDCCGPDVGEWTIRQRLVGPLPYLIDPREYYKLICCLIKERYEPTKTVLAQAEADLAGVDEKIKRYKTQLENALKPGAFEKDAKGAIPGKIDCKEYEQGKTDSDRYQSR